MATQLNIKDRETIDLAKRVAAGRRVSVTQALRDMLRREAAALDDEWACKWAEIDTLMGPAREEAKQIGMTSDHRWIYEDDDGNPLW